MSLHSTILFSLIDFFLYFPEGLKGMAIIGGAALALGSIIGLGVALARK